MRFKEGDYIISIDRNDKWLAEVKRISINERRYWILFDDNSEGWQDSWYMDKYYDLHKKTLWVRDLKDILDEN